MFLINSRLGLFTAALLGVPRKAILIPKLRIHFAEFLNKSSLAHLSILNPSTCVGFGTGNCSLKLRSFSWKHEHIDYALGAPHHRPALKYADLPTYKPHDLARDNQRPGSTILLRHSIATTISTGILTCCPSTTPFGLALGPD